MGINDDRGVSRMVDRTTLDDKHTIDVMLDCFGARGERHLGHRVINALTVLDD